MDETLILPPGVSRPAPVSEGLPTGRGLIVNETELPDYVVEGAVETFFEENSSMLGANSPTTFQTYSQLGGSLLARSKFRVPTSVVEEIILARDLAERDDDIGSSIGAMIAMGFGEGFQNTHEDPVVVALFDELAKSMELETRILPEMYRELLIASQVTTATLFTQRQLSFTPMGADRQRSRNVLVPMVGVIPAEQICVLGNDLFGSAPLAYRPFSGSQERWLEEYFSDATSAARKFEMRRQDPVLTSLLLEQVPYQEYEAGIGAVYGDPRDPPLNGRYVYMLNPTMVARSTFPKGQWPHPRPLLTRNFPLLEAKRLLNLLDYGLLEGGANFLVVAKKGTDEKPAMPGEIQNLKETIRRASRTGVIIGDHRLSIEIITPNLTELLNPGKRKLIARKLCAAMLRIPDFQDSDSGGAATNTTETEILSRVIAYDRTLLATHIENEIYEQASDRNGDTLEGAAKMWFPKIILQGAQFFTDMILKLRDRGDLPRKYGVEAAGFNYQAAVQQRAQEKANGDDRVLTTPPVPFTAQGGAGGLNDNGGGRPAGGSSANGAPGSAPGRSTLDPGARPRQLVARTQGETVRSIHEEGEADTYWRMGVQTHALMEEYSESIREGRLTEFERAALERISAGETSALAEGTLTVIPVNTTEEIGQIKPIRLAPGLSILLGRRSDDGAVLARALSFKAPHFKRLDAEELAQRWGFDPYGDETSPTVD